MRRHVRWRLNIEAEVATEYAGTKLGQYFADPDVLLATEKESAKKFYEIYGWGTPEIDSVGVCQLFFVCAVALGAHITYPEDSSPQLAGRVINNLEDIKTLRVAEHIETAGYIPDIIQRYEYLQAKSALTGVKPVFNLPAQSPLGTATLLRGTQIFYDIVKNPNETKALLEMITETAIRILRFQQEFTGATLASKFTGATLESVGMDDDYGGLFSPEIYEEFNFPYMKRIYDAFDTESRFLHSETLSREHLQFVRRLGITEYDAWPYHGLSAKDVKEELPDTFFTWNIETAKGLLTDTPSQIKEKYRQAVADGVPGQILCLCARGVARENIRAFIEVAREFE